MRLTLRTLLAYLDDILEPAQARDIGAKIAESGMAQDLVNRIKDVTRRRRVLAPDVEGPGAGLDPNLVAEYLDNTLPADDVADIERVFLESDIHLAEVAASHQILTLVLGEPVPIVPRSRERMYALGPVSRRSSKEFASADRKGLVEPATPVEKARPSPKSASVPAKAAPSSAESAASFNDRIPEYLRPKPAWQRALPLAVVLGFGAVFAYLLANDPAFRKESTDRSDDPTNSSAAIASNEPGAAKLPESGRPASAESPAATTPAATSVPAASETKPSATPRPSIDPAPPEETAGGKPVVDPAPPVEIAKPPVTGSVATAKPEPPKSSDTKPTVTKPPVTAPTERPSPLDPADGNPPAAVEPAVIEYVSVDGVLMHQDRQSRNWFLLPRRSVVRAGDRLAAPEPFESTLSISGGKLQIGVYPGSVLSITGPTEAASFGVQMRRGRLVFQSPPSEAVEGQPPSVRFHVMQGADRWLIDLDGVNAQCALETFAIEPDSFEQELGPKAWSGRLSVPAGTVRLTEPGGRKVVLDAKSAITLSPRTEMPLENVVVAGAEMPRWIESTAIRSPNRRYAVQFEKEFHPKQAVEDTLPAVVNSPTFQLSELATRALALIGDAGALVQALARSPHKETKLAAISGLRMWLGESAANGVVLKQELAKAYPAEDVDVIYRLLWGFSNADAGDPDKSQQLVDLLEHEQVAVRELAFFHLHRITGLNYNYDSQLPLAQRSLSVNRWRMHLKKEGGALLKK